MGEVHTEEGPKADILVLIEGRARYLAHLGHVKTPEILRGCAVEITRLRAALADSQAVGFAAGAEAAKTIVSLSAWKHGGDDAYSVGMDVGARHQNEQDLAAIRALTPPDATAAAARVLLPGMEQRHIDHMTSLGRDPEKYTSEYRMAAKALRAIAGDTT